MNQNCMCVCDILAEFSTDGGDQITRSTIETVDVIDAEFSVRFV